MDEIQCFGALVRFPPPGGPKRWPDNPPLRIVRPSNKGNGFEENSAPSRNSTDH